MEFIQIKKAFPIGCKVELINNDNNYKNYPLGMRGKVTAYSENDEHLLTVSWEDYNYPSNKYYYWRFRRIDAVQEITPTFDLKAANTSPLATNCASCGSKLKDPGMGPRFKYCSKCEP